MNELEYLAKVASERTPGPWVHEHGMIIGHCPLIPESKRTIQTESVCDVEQTADYDTNFIALAGTVADELIAVAVAADDFVAYPHSMRDQDDLVLAVRTLKAAIRGAMK